MNIFVAASSAIPKSVFLLEP